MALSANQSIGARAEQLALNYLLRQGLRLLEKNSRCRFGEIDLIMLDGRCLVFVEVRYRKRNRFTSAATSIGPAKQRKIIRTASFFLRGQPRYADAIIRFDVVAIDRSASDQFTIEWLRDAFRPR
jgi:putative endonuclease